MGPKMTTREARPAMPVTRLRLVLHGAVQGVGFRPFVHRLAEELGLTGWVNNSPQGVVIEVEGSRPQLEHFRQRLETDRPPRSFILSCESAWLDAVGHAGFTIRASEQGGGKTALVLPDIATCPDCLRELFDPANRRYRYPFTNCTHCGPRFSLIEALPYDRANTTMKRFRLCPACQAEYDDPRDRRFHAQPNACPVCGPRLELWPGNGSGSPAEPPRWLARDHDALLLAAHVIRCGQIVAVKGLGGFHLFADARKAAVVQRLRERKRREEKPFALMFPNLAGVREVCEVSAAEERLLTSPEAPIVLLRRRHPAAAAICDAVAPGNPNLGAMLPANPLHHLLLAELGFPVIATSGNVSDEPICADEFAALTRLHGIADVLLVHNRPIVRPIDDSIVRVVAGREMVLRRARGYAPLPVQLRSAGDARESVLAVGAHLKNTVALAVGGNVFVSQHLGDLATEPANQAFRCAVADLPRLYETTPEVVVADLHPDYLSTQFAAEMTGAARPAAAGPAPKPAPALLQVQHHVAHVLACLAENEVALPALGVAWDGTGCGTDGAIWGGEFFRVTEREVTRVASLRPFPLPGGDAAAREPRRAALGLLHELFGDDVFHRSDLPVPDTFSHAERTTLRTMLARGVNTPLCSSMGRLFDAVAALTGVRQKLGFEGQAAMELEFAAGRAVTDAAYGWRISAGPGGLTLDWAELICGVLSDVAQGVSVPTVAAKFHHALVEVIVAVARRVGCERVAVSGGCFQNRYLTERAVTRLRAAGFRPYWHQRIPTNDGGIALGQIVAARRELSLRRTVALENLNRVASPAVASAEPVACGDWSEEHDRAARQTVAQPA